MSLITELKNDYGNIDVRGSLPVGLVHIKGKRLQPTCKALGVEFAEAFVGFGGTKRFPKALTNGVVVAEADAAQIITAIEKKKEKDTPEARAKRTAAKERRQQAENEAFALKIRAQFPAMPEGKEKLIATHACKVGSGRIGRSRVAEDYGVDPVMAAVVAYVRHNCTDYEERLADGEDREEVRADIGRKIADIIRKWQGGCDEEA